MISIYTSVHPQCTKSIRCYSSTGLSSHKANEKNDLPVQVMIPISLYLSIELVKIGQVFFITQDLDLYDEEKNYRVQCRALNITEDLGQIQYVFSDKTGTLTENKMVFRRCTIKGIEFPHEDNGEFRATPVILGWNPRNTAAYSSLCCNHLFWLITWFLLVFCSNSISHSGRGDRSRWRGYLHTEQTDFSIFSGGGPRRPSRRQSELQHFCQEQISQAKGHSRNPWKPCVQQPTGEIFWQYFWVWIGLHFPSRHVWYRCGMVH